MYWGILMAWLHAAAAGPKKNRTDTCTAPQSSLKKEEDFCSVYNTIVITIIIIIIIRGSIQGYGLTWRHSNICLVPVTMT